MEELGRRIRELRRARGITQAALAEAAGVDHSYLSKIETGRLPYTPSARALRAFAAALEADELELLRLAGKMPPSLEAFADIPEAREFVRRAAGRLRTRADWKDLLEYLDDAQRRKKGRKR